MKKFAALTILTLSAFGFALSTNVYSADSKLVSAIKNNNFDEIKQIVGQGADVNAKMEYGLRPLHYAVVNSDVEVIKFLIDKGAKDDQKHTPLHRAAQRNYKPKNTLEVVKCLVENGADINAKTEKNYKKLYSASSFCR